MSIGCFRNKLWFVYLVLKESHNIKLKSRLLYMYYHVMYIIHALYYYYLNVAKCSGRITIPSEKYPAQKENVPCDNIV